MYSIWQFAPGNARNCGFLDPSDRQINVLVFIGTPDICFVLSRFGLVWNAFVVGAGWFRLLLGLVCRRAFFWRRKRSLLQCLNCRKTGEEYFFTPLKENGAFCRELPPAACVADLSVRYGKGACLLLRDSHGLIHWGLAACLLACLEGRGLWLCPLSINVFIFLLLAPVVSALIHHP